MPTVIDEVTLTRTLSRKEIANWLNVSLNSVSNMVERGEFPRPFRAGRQYRWTSDQISDWLDQQKEQGNE